MAMNNEVLRHLLATLGYRATQAFADMPPEFSEFSIGRGVRTPIEILRHMSRVLTYAHSMFAHSDYGDNYEFATGTWEWEVDRFYRVLEILDEVFIESKTGNMTWHQVVQGPLSDAITHVGQLTMLRRLADAPVVRENFMKADIRIGELRPRKLD